MGFMKILAVKYKHLMPIIKTGQQQGDFSDTVDAKQLIHIVMGT